MTFSFFKNKSILCPYCLAEIKYAGEISSCEGRECKKPFPTMYYKNHRQAPPFFIQMTGWSQVGKSAYLLALTQSLQKMDKFWGSNGFTIMAETEETMRYMQEVAIMEKNGSIPSATQLQLQQAYIMELKNMPRWGNRTVVTRDVAGEAFAALSFPLGYMPYFMHVPTTLMLFSPTDIEQDPRQQMNFLMMGFINTLTANGHDFTRQQRNIVVVISKADQLLDRRSGSQELSEELKDYLQADPFTSQASSSLADNVYMEKYMSELKQKGLKIQEYVMKKVPGGSQFVAQAKDYGIRLDFCLLSSLGGDPGPDKKMRVIQSPLRVIDPLLLALDYQSF